MYTAAARRRAAALLDNEPQARHRGVTIKSQFIVVHPTKKRSRSVVFANMSSQRLAR